MLLNFILFLNSCSQSVDNSLSTRRLEFTGADSGVQCALQTQFVQTRILIVTERNQF